MIPSFGSSGYLTLALIICASVPQSSHAADKDYDEDYTVVITAPSFATKKSALSESNSTPVAAPVLPAPVLPNEDTQNSVEVAPLEEAISAVPPTSTRSSFPTSIAAEKIPEAVIQEPASEIAKEELPVVNPPTNLPTVSQEVIPQQNNEVVKVPEPVMVAKSVPPSVPLVENADAPVKSATENYSVPEVAPAWQAQFIRNLTGNDGILTLDLQPVTQDERLQESVRIDEAVALALQNSSELKASIEGAKSKEWDTLGTYSQYLPSVNLDVATGQEQSRPASYNNINGDRELNNTHSRRDRSLLVRQPILDLSVIADIFSATHKEDIADIEKLTTRDTVALGTVNAYLKLLQAQVAIQLADQYKVYLDGLSQIMRARVEAGGATAADLDRVVSRSTLAESARMEAVGEFAINLAEFKRLTGIVPLKLVVPARLSPDIPVDVPSASKRAYINNPNYLGSLKKIELAKDDRNKSYSSMLPRVYAQYSGVYSYNAGGAANANPVDGVYATQRTDSAMIVAQWSMNGLTPVAGALSAASKEKQSYLQSLDVRQRMEQAINANYTAVGSTTKRLAVLQKTVEANERVVEGFEAQYKSGTRSLFDLLDAYEQLYSSRLNLTRVIFAYAQASFQIRQQMGDIVPSIIDTKR